MLARNYRFHGHNSLRLVYAKGSTARSRLLSMRFVHNPHRTDSRVAVVVAKKVIKAAPKRNRIRRRVYEMIREYWPTLRPGYDLAITVHSPEVLVLSSAMVRQEVESLLLAARLLGDNNTAQPDENRATHDRLRSDL